MAKRDGVADGWILYEAWCRRNGGVPTRGRDPGSHMCTKGPFSPTGDPGTIDPGDPGTVDLTGPKSGVLDDVDRDRLELAVRAATLRRDEADLDLRRVTELVNLTTKGRKRT